MNLPDRWERPHDDDSHTELPERRIEADGLLVVTRCVTCGLPLSFELQPGVVGDDGFVRPQVMKAILPYLETIAEKEKQ